MRIDQITPEALRLPVRERAALAASLWESIEDPFRIPVDLSEEEAIAIAMARDAELESGEVMPVSHGDLMARLRNEN